MLQQSAGIGVVVFDAGRGADEIGHQGLVQQKALGQEVQPRIVHAAEDLAEAGDELIDLGRGHGREVVGTDVGRFDLGQPRGDQLHGTLEKLRGPLDAYVIAVGERLVDRLGGIPHARRDAARAVGKLHLQVEVPVPIGAELFVGGDEDLVDGILRTQLAHETAGHRQPFCGGHAGETTHSTGSRRRLQVVGVVGVRPDFLAASELGLEDGWRVDHNRRPLQRPFPAKRVLGPCFRDRPGFKLLFVR